MSKNGHGLTKLTSENINKILGYIQFNVVDFKNNANNWKRVIAIQNKFLVNITMNLIQVKILEWGRHYPSNLVLSS